MRHNASFFACVIAGLLLTSCATDQYVKRDEFDTTISGLRQTDAELAENLEGIQGLFVEMTTDLHRRFADYDATLGNLQGRLRVEMTAHFRYDDANLREEDKPALREFTDVVSQYMPHLVVTVEGFTDPAGDPEYNRQLGLRRANAVRDYLIDQGLAPGAVTAVSYGEDSRRQLKPGQWGDDGAANRRVSLVVDYVGPTPGGIN